MSKIDINRTVLESDLDNCWEILAEPVQTVMRSCGIEDAYEQLKELSRGRPLNKKILHAFIETLELPDEKAKLLKNLTHSKYIGLAAELAEEI